MSENKLVGSLVLRTIDIDPTKVSTVITAAAGTVPEAVDNTYGNITALGAVVTWRRVNIRTCLGGLYNKYNTFNLKLTSAQIRQNQLTTNGDLFDAQYVIYMSGLPFSSGSCYSTRFGPTNQAALACVNFDSTSAAGVTNAFSSGLVSFDKPLQDVIDITIELKNSSTVTQNGYSEKTNQVLGHWSLIFDIYGIDK
jgi:hypothetical protein